MAIKLSVAYIQNVDDKKMGFSVPHNLAPNIAEV